MNKQKLNLDLAEMDYSEAVEAFEDTLAALEESDVDPIVRDLIGYLRHDYNAMQAFTLKLAEASGEYHSLAKQLIEAAMDERNLALSKLTDTRQQLVKGLIEIGWNNSEAEDFTSYVMSE